MNAIAATTIVVPVYNEGENILKTLAELDAKVSVPSETWLVYDRDDDTTLAPARTLLGKTRIPFALVKNKYGRGALNAIKTGLEDAKTPLVVVTMADLCDPPEVINDLVAAGILTRSRLLDPLAAIHLRYRIVTFSLMMSVVWLLVRDMSDRWRNFESNAVRASLRLLYFKPDSSVLFWA